LGDPDPAGVPPDVREYLQGFPPDPLVRMLTHSVATVKPFIEQAMAQFSGLELPARSRELVILTVAELAECEFVRAQHEPIAAKAGVEPRVSELIRRREFAELTPADRVLVEFTAAVLAGPRVRDELFGRLRDVLTERETVEALQVCGYYWSFCRVCTVLEVELTKVYG
jgi:alkylhydroperoxidase family enzyme